MRCRKLDFDGDYVFGHGDADFHRDSPEAVAQAVATRLRLLAGEWFLDNQEGTAYAQAALGRHTQDSRDPMLRARILDTQGVTGISAYESTYDGETRRLTVNATIDTAYGSASLREVL